MPLSSQIIYLFLLALPVACVAWTVTHETIFEEMRGYCVKWSKDSTTLLKRKFFYLFTCEYCFSHYVTFFFLIITNFRLLYEDWRGLLIAFFAIVWIANFYMTIFGFMRQSLKVERLEGHLKDSEWQEVKSEEKI